MPVKQANITSEPLVGATINASYVERTMTVFAISESEVRTISMFNTLSTVFFSVGSSLVSIAISVWINYFFSEKATHFGEILSKVIAPLLIVLSIVFFGLAIWARINRGTTWDLIRRESITKTK